MSQAVCRNKINTQQMPVLLKVMFHKPNKPSSFDALILPVEQTIRNNTFICTVTFKFQVLSWDIKMWRLIKDVIELQDTAF